LVPRGRNVEKALETPMNADATPMAADKTMEEMK
jgi:hypothetical protein